MQVDDGLLSIGQVSGATGVAVSALRYYETVGLLAPTARRGGQRRYAPEVLQRLAAVRLCRSAGFRLEEIAALLAGTERLAAADGWRKRVADKVDELDARVVELQELRDGLAALAACPEADPLRCAHVQDALASARSTGTSDHGPGSA